MLKFNIIFISSIIFVVASECYLSDGVNRFNFKKTHDGSDEYDFEYTLDNGTTFTGRTFLLNDPEAHLYIMFGADDVAYWVEFTQDEYENEQVLSKIVRLVDRSEDKALLQNDFVQYEITISEASMFVQPYQTKWDLEKICFTNNDNQTYKYLISATNNSRKFNGTTYLETDDPHIQRIHLKDGNQRNDVYEIHFTDEELKSHETFCKGIFKQISVGGVLGAYPVSNINPNLLKSLAG